MNWHCLDKKDVFELLGTSRDGLDPEIAGTRLLQYGPNELPGKKRISPWIIFLRQFQDFMIVVLIVAAAISGIIGDLLDFVIILVIILINAILGFIQQYRAEKAVDSLKKIASTRAVVIRKGAPAQIDTREIVPGDVLLIESGDIVPADLRLLEVNRLYVDESMLTGESQVSIKNIKTLKSPDEQLADRTNLAFRGTSVSKGNGIGIVVGTGMNTEIGKIVQLLAKESNETPLQKRMKHFGQRLSYIILFICALLFGVGIIRGEQPVQMFLLAVSLAVAAIPETLPALITITLSIGAKRLAQNKALVRKLTAVEGLGSVTYICSDKTGTLTENKMKVVNVVSFEDAFDLDTGVPFLEMAMAMNHDVRTNDQQISFGEPGELAILQYGRNKYGKDIEARLLHRFPRVAEIPFDPERKCMTTIHRIAKEKFIAITKGAPEAIAEILEDPSQAKEMISKMEIMGKIGIRVLGYAYRELDSFPIDPNYELIEKNMRCAGLVGLHDPPRLEVKSAIEECKSAGIQPVMITGDHMETAAAIARQIGLLSEKEYIVTGRQLNNFSQGELDEKVEKIKVYARVSPTQKFDIVKALQRKQQFVAMTGDGINDAPSLKAADIGVAMGITGTDVTKEAADIILLDDNFVTIVKAVKEGRRIYDNIRKFVKYILTCNSAELWTIFLAPLVGLPIPLLPVHILWINLVTDGLPGLALSAEKAERDIMKRPPRKPGESLFAGGTGIHIIWVGLFMALITLSVQAWAIRSFVHWQTMVFTVLAFCQLAHVFAIRSENNYIYKQGLFSNRALAFVLLATFIVQLFCIYLPVANTIFKTQPLSFIELLICLLIPFAIFHAVEIEKFTRKLRRRYTDDAQVF